MLLARCSGVDIAFAVDGERGNFFPGRAVENERFAIRRDPVDQSAAIGTGNQVSLGIECEHANVNFIALEEKRVLAVGADFVDFAVIAGGDIQGASIVENDIPDVLGAGIEVGSRGPGCLCIGLRSGLAAFRGFETIHLAVGCGRGVDGAVFVDDQSLHLQFLRLEDGRALTIGRDAIDPGWRSGGSVDVARGIGCDRPDVGRRRGRKRFERRSEFEAALTAQSDAIGSALGQFFELGLFPGAGALGESEGGQCEGGKSKCR